MVQVQRTLIVLHKNMRNVKTILFCVAVFVCCGSAYTQSPTLRPRAASEVFINNPLAPDPLRELLPVVVEGKCGFIDRKGNIVIKPQFDGCADFYEGLAVVMVGSKTMVIDKKGQTVFEPELPLLTKFFSDGLISFCGSTGPCTPRGYLDKKGRIAIKPQFQIAQPFSEGRALINVDGKWGYIDKQGRTVIAPRFLGAVLSSMDWRKSIRSKQAKVDGAKMVLY